MVILGRSRLVFVLFVATVMGIPLKRTLHGSAASAEPRTGSRTTKRQEVIYLLGDISKRNRKEESMASMEKHGRSLTAEGRLTNKSSNGNAYEDVKEYHRSSFEVLSVDKNKGPPQTEDAANAKSDAYEVISEHDNSADKNGANEDHEIHEHVANGASTESQVLEGKHGDGAGFHIVSLNKEKMPPVDKDESVYGTIESRPLESISSTIQSGSDERNHMNTKTIDDDQKHDNHNNYDSIPSSILSVGQNEVKQFPVGSVNERPTYLTPHDREDGFNQPLVNPYRFEETPHWHWGRRRHPFWPRHSPPIIYYVPRDQSEIHPFSSQTSPDVYRPKQQGYPERPYMGLVNDEEVRRHLIQSMFGFPLVQPQSSPLIPAQVAGPSFPVSQTPVLGSPILQMQPLVQPVPATPFLSQPTGPSSLMIPTSPAMMPSLVQGQALAPPSPQSSWVDSPGYSRSGVLYNGEHSEEGKEEGNDNDSEEDFAANESREDEGNYEDRREEYSRQPETYHDDEPEREYETEEADRADESHEDEPVEEEYSEENAAQRSFAHYDTDEESDPGEATSHYLEPSSEPERPEQESYREDPYSSVSNENSLPEERSSRLISGMTPMDRTLDERRPESPQSDQVFSRYSAPPREFHKSMYQGFTQFQTPTQPKMEISEMSAAQARFLGNKEHRDPAGYFGPVSKNTIPRRGKYEKSGLENVLIRLNGKPLENSAELRSRIIDGKIVQGKGKLIKSKGPVNVRLSHANDAKHTKIIDIISRQKYKVYDTKSKITKPAPMPG